jgi:ferrochelatase
MKTAALLMAHGTPDSLDEIEPYLRRVMTRRLPTAEFVEVIRDRYRQIGGRSPLTDITHRQAAKLSSALAMPVYVGMRHWNPSIADAVARAEREGVQRLVGICAAPHFATISIGAYETAMAVPPGMEKRFIRQWHLEPALVECWRTQLAPGVHVLYTAHSIPADGAEPYPSQLQQTLRAIALPGSLAFQSRSPSPVPWLEPDVDTVLGRLKEPVQVAPIGFVSDHVEVLYDIDILHAATAKRLGVPYSRVPMPNDDPLLIEAMASAVRKALA